MACPLDTATLEMLGKARKVVVTKDETTIIEGAGDAAALDGRVAQIRAEIATPIPTTTARSCRSAWQSSPVVWLCSRLRGNEVS